MHTYTFISLLNTREQLVTTLYHTFAETYPRQATFWEPLAIEEENFSKILDSLAAKSEAGKLVCNIDMEEIEILYDFVDELKRLVQSCQTSSKALTEEEAIQAAEFIEFSALMRLRKDILSVDNKEIKSLLLLLENEALDHLDAIRQFAERHGVTTGDNAITLELILKRSYENIDNYENELAS